MENHISIDEIKVNCNFQIKQLKKLLIREEMGMHTVAEIVAGIEAGSLQIESQQLNSQPLVIEAVKDGKRTLLFSGVISEVHLDSEAGYEIISIMAYSLSWFMDLEKKNRSFQGEHSILELIRKICRENSFLAVCSADDKETDAPFIQYRETDWEFLRRVSSHLQVPFYAAGDYEDKGICLGIREEGTPVKLDALTEKWCMDAERFKSMNFDAEKALYYEVICGQVLHLGQSALYQDQILWVFETAMILQHGMLICSYKLAGPRYHAAVFPCYNPLLKGVSLEGTVLDRKEEAVKIHLDIDDEQDRNNAHLYPWLPEFGNMVYCMPEEGSKVRLLIPEKDERNAIGTSCVRQNGGTCRETQVTEHRWFITDQDKKFTLQPDLMVLSGEKGKSAVSFQDGTGSSISSSENILIQAKGNIFMQGTKVTMNAPGEITVIKREPGDPAVVNICHNLDAIGKQTKFYNLDELNLKKMQAGGSEHGSGQALSEEAKAGMEEEKKKLRFELQELMKQENAEKHYELGASIVNIISAIPQCPGQDRLSQIAMGFRPIAGRMKR